MIDKRLFMALAFLTLLASCGGGETEEGDVAPGEVLEGTISDAMLPVDRLRSEPPLESPERLSETPGGGGGAVTAQAPADAAIEVPEIENGAPEEDLAAGPGASVEE